MQPRLKTMRLNAILIGAQKAGKSTLLNWLTTRDSQEFSVKADEEPTNGVDHRIRIYELSTGFHSKLVFYDPSGNPRFRDIVRSYYPNKPLGIFVLDGNQDFETQARMLKEEGKKFREANGRCSTAILVVTKDDLKKEYNSSGLLSLRREMNITEPIVYLSSKNKQGLEELNQLISKKSEILWRNDPEAFTAIDKKNKKDIMNCLDKAITILNEEKKQLGDHQKNHSRAITLKGAIDKMESVKNAVKKDKIWNYKELRVYIGAVINDTFIASLDRYKGDKSFKTWCKKIVLKILNALTFFISLPLYLVEGNGLFLIAGTSERAARRAAKELQQSNLLPNANTPRVKK